MAKRKVTILAEYPPGGSMPTGVDPCVSAVQVGDLIFTSGIIGVDGSGALGTTPEAQFELAFGNMKTLLEKAGSSLDEVGLVSVFIPGPDYRSYINAAWLPTFPNEADRPARKTNHVNLSDGVVVTLQAHAVAGGKRERLDIANMAHRDPIPNGCKIGNMVFSSVLISQSSADGTTPEDKIDQIETCFENSRLLMESAGATLDTLVHMLVFMSDFDYQPKMVDIWVNTWPQDGDRPARKTLRYEMGGLIQAQVIGLTEGKRTNYEIPGVGHHDPIPMGARVGNVFFSSGISGSDPAQGGATVEGLEPQIAFCESGSKTLMEQAGGSLDDVGLVTVLISEWESIPAVWRSFEKLFPSKQDRPALRFIDWRMGRGTVQYHLAAVI